jgi:hypothetical protein
MNGEEVKFYFTVSEKPESVSFREDADYRVPDYMESMQLVDGNNGYITFLPDNVSKEAFTYKSSNSSVIQISQTGSMYIS